MTLTKSQGFTLVEVLIVLVVSVSALTLAGQYMGYYSDALVNQSAAEQQRKIGEAATAYIKDNYAAVVAVATPTSPAVITTTMLKSTGYLSAAVSDTNAYGQTYSIRALEPVANKLETLIVTVGGETVTDVNIKRAAQLIGAAGGYVSVLDTANAMGSFGGWKVPLANYGITPGAGHLATALMFSDAALLSDYLYRNAVAGHPEFNRMNTAIDMTNHDINNAGTVNSNYLNAGQNVTAGSIVAAGSTVTSGADVLAGRDVHADRNVAGSNDVTAGRNVSAGNDAVATNNVIAGRNVSAGIDVSAGNNVSAGNTVHAGNLVRSEGRVSAGEYLHVAGSAGEGGGCSPDGLIAQGATSLVVCSGGRWVAVGAKKPYVGSGYTSNGYIPYPSGYTACHVLKVPSDYWMYDGGRNEPDGLYHWTEYGSNDGDYIIVCAE